MGEEAWDKELPWDTLSHICAYRDSSIKHFLVILYITKTFWDEEFVC